MLPWARKSLIPLLSLILLMNPVWRVSTQTGYPNEPVQAQSSLTYIVDRLTDSNPDGGGEGSGLMGDLRSAMTTALLSGVSRPRVLLELREGFETEVADRARCSNYGYSTYPGARVPRN